MLSTALFLFPTPTPATLGGGSQKIGVSKAACEELRREAEACKAEGRRVVVLTGETGHYRQASRTVATSEDDALEVGSSYGDCTEILRQRCRSARGVEKSKSATAEATRKFPGLQGTIDVIDCLHEKDAVQMAKCCANRTLACVDIGGDRHAEAVLQLVAGSLGKVPVVVVKARLLYRACAAKALKADDAAAAGGSGAMGAFWDAATRDALATGDAGLGVPKWSKRPKETKKQLNARLRAERQSQREGKAKGAGESEAPGAKAAAPETGPEVRPAVGPAVGLALAALALVVAVVLARRAR